MKILVVASTFPASDTDKSPAFVRDQVMALRERHGELRVSVLAPHYRDETAGFARHADYDEYRFTYFVPRKLQQLAGRGILPSIESRPALMLLVPFLFLFELIALVRLTRRLRPDFIYAHWFTPQGVTAAITSKLTGTPFVLTSHANDVRVWSKIPLAGRLVVRGLLPAARRITAVSSRTYEKMRDFFSPEEWGRLSSNVAIIPMGVDVARFRQRTPVQNSDLKRRYGCEGRYVILFLGRLASKKGVGYLIDAMVRIKSPAVRVVIAGDGPSREALERQTAEFGLDDVVHFVGYATGQEKLDYLGMADLVVVPSVEAPSGDTEGFPVVIMEAMAAGKICIATDVSGADAVVITGQNGFIVPQKRSDALATQIEAVMAMEPSQRCRMEALAEQTVQSLDWSVIADRHYEFLFSSLPAEGDEGRKPGGAHE